MIEENGFSIFEKGDVFIIDRAFRDVKSFPEVNGFIVLIRALKGKNATV